MLLENEQLKKTFNVLKPLIQFVIDSQLARRLSQSQPKRNLDLNQLRRALKKTTINTCFIRTHGESTVSS